MASKRKTLTIKQKIDILDELKKPGFRPSDAATKYNIPRSSVSTIIKSEMSLREQYTSCHIDPKSKRKRFSSGKDHEIEEKLFAWFQEKRRQGVLMSGPVLIAKAKSLSDDGGTFGEGWLRGFKDRYNIVFKKAHGEKAAADNVAAEEWIAERWPELAAEFDPKDIWNADETGLFFRGLSDRGFVGGSEGEIAGGKVAKDRLSVLVTCSMVGKKLPLLVIGKSKNPRHFPKNHSLLPVTYRSSKKAWMTSSIFSEFLRSWDMKLRSEGERILVLVDNAPSHPNIDNELSNIKLEFLPKNTTSLIQPCDAGIINCLKVHYKGLLCDRVIGELDGLQGKTAEQEAKKVSILDAIHLMSQAWRSVKVDTIKNCFAKALKGDHLQIRENYPTNTRTEEDLERIVREEENLLAKVEENECDEMDVEEEEVEDGEETACTHTVSPERCLEVLASLRTFCQLREFSSEVHDSLTKIENCALQEVLRKPRQTKVTDFFK